MAVPDPQALAAQGKVIEAQKEFASIQLAQTVRSEKAKTAVNFILLPLQTPDGVKRQEPEDTPECKAARAACYRYLEAYFSTTTDFEAGVALYEEPVSQFATA
jgi:hypothetical protein